MVHCTQEKVAPQIVDSGFGALAQWDAGYYGLGVYFTRDMAYSRMYGDHKTFIVAAVIAGNSYPATEHPFGEDRYSLKGRARIPGYQSHYTVG